MSQEGRGGEGSDVGDAPAAPVHPSTGETPAGTEADSIDRIASLSLVDKGKQGPLTPTTPTTADAATTGSQSEQSSEHGGEEGAASQEQPRQVIAVSVSKGPSAFFNLARKFLVTDEECDLSALEGAIVSAVDAAHLLERSKIATIVKIQTSYVTVEPKKKREHGPISGISEGASGPPTESGATSATTGTPTTMYPPSSVAAAAQPGPSRIDQPGISTTDTSSSSGPQGKQKPPAGTMRRARIVITVKRTDAYKKWLEENPIQDIHAGQDDDHI